MRERFKKQKDKLAEYLIRFILRFLIPTHSIIVFPGTLNPNELSFLLDTFAEIRRKRSLMEQETPNNFIH